MLWCCHYFRTEIAQHTKPTIFLQELLTWELLPHLASPETITIWLWSSFSIKEYFSFHIGRSSLSFRSLYWGWTLLKRANSFTRHIGVFSLGFAILSWREAVNKKAVKFLWRMTLQNGRKTSFDFFRLKSDCIFGLNYFHEF